MKSHTIICAAFAVALVSACILAADSDTADDDFVIRDFTWTVADVSGAKFQIRREGKSTTALIVAGGNNGGMEMSPKAAEAVAEVLADADKGGGDRVVKRGMIHIQFRSGVVTIAPDNLFTENVVKLTRVQAAGLAKLMRRAVKAAAFADERFKL